MWTPATRAQHMRVSERYQTDLSDAEWKLIAEFLPAPCSTGRWRDWPMREIVNAFFYILRGGIPWRLLPKDLPPWQMVYRLPRACATRRCSSGYGVGAPVPCWPLESGRSDAKV